MKRMSTLFLKLIFSLVGIMVLTGLIVLPQNEGRAANLDIMSIYADPFIIFIYTAFIPFFITLYQAFKLLGYVEKNHFFSQAAVKAVQIIKYCAITFVVFAASAVLYIFLMSKTAASDDDPVGFLVVGTVVIFASTVIATAVAVFQKLLQNAIDIKEENDLVV